MAKQTVQGLILERITKVEDKLDNIIPVLAGLKVKAAIAGGMAGLVGTGIIAAIVSAWK